MPTYHNPTGRKAYIMNMYTAPEYRRQGIAIHTLDLLVNDARKQGVSQIALEATDMGRPLYEKYGFVKMEDENGADIVSRKVTNLQPWECLMKRIVWKQLGEIRDKKILDFGSGIGATANYLAEHNDVTAIEPDEDSIKERWADNQYTQIAGSTDELRKFADETFDMIICHNVLEYAKDRPDIVKEFARILKPNGKISIVKHNRAGRVMQMVVL